MEHHQGDEHEISEFIHMCLIVPVVDFQAIPF